MTNNYIRYTQADLENQSIDELAIQYAGVDMWELHGISENYFPFVVMQDGSAIVMFWSKQAGIVNSNIDDPVFHYAFAEWLTENAHPVFDNLDEAQAYAEEREWPRS